MTFKFDVCIDCESMYELLTKYCFKSRGTKIGITF